jgi:hypothetical protein
VVKGNQETRLRKEREGEAIAELRTMIIKAVVLAMTKLQNASAIPRRNQPWWSLQSGRGWSPMINTRCSEG